MHPMLNIATRAACKAGNFIAKRYETLDRLKINYQKNSNDFLINVEKVAEALITETICKSYSQFTVFSKNIGKYKDNDQGIQWIIDPLNGITNFIKNLPHFAVSIAVRIKCRTEIAVVYDPIRNELFTATRGHGAQLNGYRLRGNNIRNLNDAILAIGFPFKERQNITTYMNIIKELFAKCSDFRRTGSTALDLSYIAAGRIDGYFEIGLKPWNFIAGELIARESGALICDFNGGHDYMITGNIVVGNSQVIKSILANIRNELNRKLG